MSVPDSARGGAAWSSVDPDAPTPGYDAPTLRAALTWPNWIAASAVALALAAGLGTPAAAALGGRARVAQALLLAWPLTYGLGVAARDRLFRDPALAPARTLALLHGVALLALPGALSRRDLDATWALLLLVAPCWGELFPFNRAVLAGLLLVPPALRLALADAPAPASLLAAAAVGAVAALGHALVSARSRRRRAADEGALAATALGADSLAEAGALLTAVRLHDGLSGAVSLARVRADRDEAGAAAVHRLAAHVRDVCAALDGAAPTRCAADVRAALARAAPTLGVEADVRDLGAPSVDGVWREVRDALIEVLANEARHGGARRVTVTLAERGGAVRVSADSSLRPRATDASHRGLRNLARRVAARGGTLTLPAPGRPTVAFALPLGGRPTWRDALLAAGDAAIFAAPTALAWRQSGRAAAAVGVAAVSALLYVVQWRNGAQVRAAVAARRRALEAGVEAAARPAVEAAVARLAPAADALDAAARGGDPAALRAAVAATAGALEHLLRTFEAGRAAALSGAAGPGARPPAPPRCGS